MTEAQLRELLGLVRARLRDNAQLAKNLEAERRTLAAQIALIERVLPKVKVDSLL